MTAPSSTDQPTKSRPGDGQAGLRLKAGGQLPPPESKAHRPADERQSGKKGPFTHKFQVLSVEVILTYVIRNKIV